MTWLLETKSRFGFVISFALGSCLDLWAQEDCNADGSDGFLRCKST